MAWVVDTRILIDVAEGDPDFGPGSGRLLDRKRPAGLLVAPVSYVELSPRFRGVENAQNDFLENIQVHFTEPWTWRDTMAAYHAWNHFIAKRRRGEIAKRPIADILIGAFASRFDGLLTRNPRDFQKLFPTLRIETPK